MREGLAAVLLCTLVVTAGCSALSGSGGNATGEKTEPDAPVDDVDTDGIPGIEDEQLANETALLDAHVENITETGYSHDIRTNTTTVQQNRTVEVTRKQRTVVAANATEYRLELISNGTDSSRIITWGNKSVAVQRGEIAGGDPQYRPIEPQPADALAARSLLEERLSSAFEVVDVQQREDAPDLVTLETDGLSENNTVFSGIEAVENVREFNARLVVDTEGRIRSYGATAVYDIENETGEYDFTYEMTGFEDPGVERPEWAEESGG